MDARSPRWRRVTPSHFPWEDDAIDFIRSRLPDLDPNRAWSNFSFTSGGAISEVDVFAVTKQGAFLIEIKSTPGILRGDQQTWVFERPDGGRSTMRNPLFGADLKAKRIRSLLERQWRSVAGNNATQPFIRPLVFLSAEDLDVRLDADARLGVCRPDVESIDLGPYRGIIATLTQPDPNGPHRAPLNTPTSDAIDAALQKIGLRESDHTRTVGSWLLHLDSVEERPGIQDFIAAHKDTPTSERRIRIYSRDPGMSEEQTRALAEAARREFEATERLGLPGVVRAFDKIDTELGSAVVFEYDPRAQRLDHWISEHKDADLGTKLEIAQQIAETMHAVHRAKVTHRALAPGSILVTPTDDPARPWSVRIADFSLAAKASGGTQMSRLTRTRFGRQTVGAADAALIADPGAGLYQAPEADFDGAPDGVLLDVFSFGCVLFHLLAREPAADSEEALRAVLTESGLQLAARVPGIDQALHDLVEEATCPVVSDRMSSFADALAGIDLARESLAGLSGGVTQPQATAPAIDPLDARPGDRLEDGSTVKRRLGRGSTAVALLVDRPDGLQPAQVVYKIAVNDDAARRIAEEHRVLDGLSHDAIVRTYGTMTVSGRAVLMLAFAGEQSLAAEIRSKGSPGIEFLQRWGDDLLGALAYLEQQGRHHRDIKPENLGITQVGRNREQRLVLYDFSLATASADDVLAGTPPYLEPFLGGPNGRKWDLAAERYAAAVTLYELATAELPIWGDGRTAPAFVTGEVTINAPALDGAARDQLVDFFTKSLRRDPAERFGNADEMRRAWQRVFEGVADEPEPADGGASGTAEPAFAVPAGVRLDDPVVSLGVGGKVHSALLRLGANTVRDVAALVPMQVNSAGRIKPRTRRRVNEIRAVLLEHFAEELAAEQVVEPAADTPTVLAPVPVLLDLDSIVRLLVPAASRRGKSTERDAVQLLLGLSDLAQPTKADWPTHDAVARTLDVTPGRIGQIGPNQRRNWANLGALASVRDEVVAMVEEDGGISAVRELEPRVLASRGTRQPVDTARAMARAVTRAAVDTEANEPSETHEPRLVARRAGDRVLVALDSDDLPVDGVALTDYAAALGKRADQLVDGADLIPADFALAALRDVVAPNGFALPDGRLVRLAAAASQTTGVTDALELYPRDLTPVAAVRLARASFAGAKELTVDAVIARLRARFPDVVLPSRPELDAVLSEAEVPMAWSEAEQVYKRGETLVGSPSSATALVERKKTVAGRVPIVDEDPVLAEATRIEQRLRRSLEHGGFLAIRVPVSQRRALQRELVRFTDGPDGVASVDLEAWFLESLRAIAAERNVQWAKIIEADLAPAGSNDFVRLRQITDVALGRVVERLRASGPRVIAWNVGVFARYGALGRLDEVRQRVGFAGEPLQTLWVVTYGGADGAAPKVDGEVLPVAGNNEWIGITEGWLSNAHRAVAPGAAG